MYNQTFNNCHMKNAAYVQHVSPVAAAPAALIGIGL